MSKTFRIDTNMALTIAVLMTSAAAAQQVYVSGLAFPSKVIAIPNGYLLVTEAGNEPNSGRVTLVGPGGATRNLVAGLPSGLGADGPDGPNGLYLNGRVLYIASGEGDRYRRGMQPGTQVPNPQGNSSPLLSSILKITFDRDVDQYQSPFTLKPEDHLAIVLGYTITLNDGSGDSALFDLVTNFPDTWPDPRTIYRNSHPYGLTMHPNAPDTLFTPDAGMNLVWQTNAISGRTKALVQFPNIPNNGPGPASREAVPTSVRACGDQLLVTLLSGGPFAPGYASILAVNPRTGEATTFKENLNSAMDVACAAGQATDVASYFVLELSTNLGATPPPPGRVLRYEGPNRTAWLEGLNTPTSLALDESTGAAYIVSRSDGTILTAKFR